MTETAIMRLNDVEQSFSIFFYLFFACSVWKIQLLHHIGNKIQDNWLVAIPILSVFVINLPIVVLLHIIGLDSFLCGH